MKLVFYVVLNTLVIYVLFLLAMVVLFCATAAAQIPQLDDERIGERFAQAREYRLSSVCIHNNTALDCRKEIGPLTAKNTLAGMEFPWKHPGGRFRSDLTTKYVWPPDVAAKIVRAHYPRLRGHIRAYSRPGWTWPENTTFFELHFHPAGHPFELRVLEKTGDGIGFQNYEPHIFRPWNDPEDLPFNPTLRRTQVLEVTSNHPRRPFVSRGEVSVYADQAVDWGELVASVAWEDGLGHEWHHAGEGDGWLSPRGYAGWMVGNGDRCSDCHDTAGSPAVYFDPIRDWYGFNRGDDGIFSFDPIDRRTVSFSGPHGRGWRWTNN